jgi:hypothetical protein
MFQLTASTAGNMPAGISSWVAALPRDGVGPRSSVASHPHSWRNRASFRGPFYYDADERRFGTFRVSAPQQNRT